MSCVCVCVFVYTYISIHIYICATYTLYLHAQSIFVGGEGGGLSLLQELECSYVGLVSNPLCLSFRFLYEKREVRVRGLGSGLQNRTGSSWAIFGKVSGPINSRSFQPELRTLKCYGSTPKTLAVAFHPYKLVGYETRYFVAATLTTRVGWCG